MLPPADEAEVAGFALGIGRGMLARGLLTVRRGFDQVLSCHTSNRKAPFGNWPRPPPAYDSPDLAVESAAAFGRLVSSCLWCGLSQEALQVAGLPESDEAVLSKPRTR